MSSWTRLRAGWRSGPLAVPGFRLLVGGQFASTIGDFCYAVALPWLVLSTHGGAILLGAVLACYGVPRTVLIPVGGVLADKMGPRTLMLIADTVRCVLVAALTVLALRHMVSLAALGPIAALIGAGEGLFIPASFAIMPSLLSTEQLTAGNALSTAAVQTGSLLGPALAGALVAVTRSSTAAFGVDAASFAISALSLALIRRQTTVESAAAEMAEAAGVVDAGEAEDAQEAGSGGGMFDLLRRSRALQVTLVVAVVANLANGGMGEVALPSLAHAHYGAAGYGALLACLAVGAIVGTLGATRTGGLRVPMPFAAAMYLVSGAAIGLIPYLGGEAGAAAALFVCGIASGLASVTFITAVQKWAPPALLGRALSLMLLCALGSFPLSVLIAGVLVRHLGPVLFFPVAGGLIAVGMLFGLSQRAFRELGATERGDDQDAPAAQADAWTGG